MHVVASVVSCTAQHSAVSIEYPLITWYIQLLQQHSVCTAKHGALQEMCSRKKCGSAVSANKSGEGSVA